MNLAQRGANDLLVRRIADLRNAFRMTRREHPFRIEAIVILPDHLHCLWTLPEEDADFPMRWRLIKARFSGAIPPGERISASRVRRGERGIWQRRYWEHAIRDDRDFQRHIDYIHCNPVKHRLAARAYDCLPPRPNLLSSGQGQHVRRGFRASFMASHLARRQVGRDIAAHVDQADHVQMIRMLDIEQGMRKVLQKPEAKLRDIQLVRIPGRSGGRVRFDVAGCVLKFINEPGGYMHRLGFVEIQRRLDIRFRQRRTDSRLHALFLDLLLFCLRSAAK